MFSFKDPYARRKEDHCLQKKRSDCLTASKNYFLFLLPIKYSIARNPANSPAALLKIRYSFSTLLVNFPICHSISCKPFLHRYLNKNEHIWQLISLAIAKTRFRCYHMVKEISFNPPASKATAERRVFLCKGVRSRGEIRPDQKAQHQ